MKHLVLATTILLAAHPTMPRSEALRQSEIALMQDRQNPHFAHPFFWAPFSVVGEGGGRGG